MSGVLTKEVSVTFPYRLLTRSCHALGSPLENSPPGPNIAAIHGPSPCRGWSRHGIQRVSRVISGLSRQKSSLGPVLVAKNCPPKAKSGPPPGLVLAAKNVLSDTLPFLSLLSVQIHTMDETIFYIYYIQLCPPLGLRASGKSNVFAFDVA